MTYGLYGYGAGMYSVGLASCVMLCAGLAMYTMTLGFGQPVVNYLRGWCFKIELSQVTVD